MNAKELRVEVLGPLRVRFGDEEVNLGPARQCAVFAALATWPSTKPLSRAELIRAVWGESAPPSADGSVQTYISGLRRALDPARTRWSTDGPIVSDGQGYRLTLARDGLDTYEFDRLREHGETLRTANDLRGAVGHWERALGLWRGDALAGIPGPWAESVRVRLTSARLAVVEARAADLLALGSHEDLIPQLIVLVREHPLLEGLWHSLMLALHLSGRTIEALDAYRQVGAVLRSELGVAPGPELRTLHQRLLSEGGSRDAPVARPALLSVLPSQVEQAFAEPAPLNQGRAEEISLVTRLLDDVLAGRGRGLWLEGVPGIGKSSLLASALRAAARRGCHVAWGAATTAGRRFPMQVLAHCLGLGADQDQHDRDTFPIRTDELLAHVAALCTRAPLVLVVDDLHWADDATLEAWRQLTTAARRLPLLLVATSRTPHERDELTQLRRVVQLHGHEVLTLGPLPEADMISIVRDYVEGVPGPTLRSLVARSSGNPLYMKEVLGALAADGVLTFNGDEVDVQEDALYEPPQSLVDAVTRTLDMLDGRTRDLLRRASVLGVEFRVGQAAAVVGEPVSRLLPAFENAITSRVVADAGLHMVFRHHLLQVTLYREIPSAARRVLHLRAARVLADAGGTDEQIAQQLVAARALDDPWANTWIVDHRETLANRAPLVAAELMKQVLHHGTGPSQSLEDLTHTYVLLLYRLGREPETLARKAMTTMSDPGRAAEMRHITAAMLHRRGATDEAFEVLALNDGPDVPSFWRQRMRALKGIMRSDRSADVEFIARQAEEISQRVRGSDEPYPVAVSLQASWFVQSVRRDHEAALDLANRGVSALRGHDEHADLRASLIANQVFSLQNLDRLDEAGDVLRAARSAAGRAPLALPLQCATAVQGFWTGDWDASLAMLDAVTENGPGMSTGSILRAKPFLQRVYGVTAMINHFRGDGDEATRLVEQARSRFGEPSAEQYGCNFLLMAECLLRALHDGDVEQSLVLAAPMLDSSAVKLGASHQWMPAVARLAVNSGNSVVAAEALAACEREAERERTPGRADCLLLWCRGIVAGDPDQVLEAADRFRSQGRVVELSSALADAGQLLAGTVRRAQAQACLNEAASILARLGSLYDREVFETRMSRFGLRPSSPR